MKIYTKTGDKGETSLFTGKRVAKNDHFIEALGTVDECNSTLGVAVSLMQDHKELQPIKKQLETIQHTLFDVGAAIATPRSEASNSKIEKTRFDEEGIHILETWIDKMEEELPKLHAFILPGGSPQGAALHLARSICRRAERMIVPLNKQKDVADHVTIYLNRLSDYLFVASRYVNFKLNAKETTWEPHKLH
ncbi:MAG TPA: cob(I)yrinic acid a,c-diamide adenosyltransferase [Parachlamydiaceae bacterium]|nr:cob(I)yrinic acid a,c-diamide adenosyltransferase [Parachlamydiaceae bacterium]